MANVKSYSSKKVIVIVNGTALSGFVDGSFVTVERETDSFTKTVGTDGEVARNTVSNKTGSVTFTLMQTSDYNSVLSSILKRSENGDDVGVFNVEVKDTLNNATYTGSGCWIRRAPNAEYANEVGGFEWVIDCAELLFDHKSIAGSSLEAYATTTATIDSRGNVEISAGISGTIRV